MKRVDFRQHVLAALHEAKARLPLQHLHLLYAPELADPLLLAGTSKRDTAHIRAPSGDAEWPREAWPFLVTLDCRRLAGGPSMQSDPGFDDPLLEASIAQAHAEVREGQRVRVEVSSDDPGMAEAVCGWIVSPEPVAQLASRINRHAALFNSQDKRRWVRWYQPACICLLWPTLGVAQRQALLGRGTWVAYDAVGHLRCFTADPDAGPSADPPPDLSPASRYRSVAQWDMVDNVVVVTELLRQWHAFCFTHGRTLPRDAGVRLNAHVRRARGHGLDAEDLAFYALLAVQLLDGAMQSPDFLRLLHDTRVRGEPLRDALESLPDTFWSRYLPNDVTARQALQRATHRGATSPDP